MHTFPYMYTLSLVLSVMYIHDVIHKKENKLLWKLPCLVLQEYEEECSKLECILSSMEQNIKKLLSDYDSKKKVCSITWQRMWTCSVYM